MKLKIALIALSILSACHSAKTHGNIDGGNCTFRNDSFPIRVVQIEQQGKDTSFDIFFRYVDRNDSLDTIGDPLIYSVYTHGHYAGRSELQQYGITPGYTCTLIESQTVFGGCGGGHSISLDPWKAH